MDPKQLRILTLDRLADKTLRDLELVEDRKALLIKVLSDGHTDMYRQVQEEQARVYWDTKVTKCGSCAANGWYCISAGGGEWTEECESCAGTGYVPIYHD